MSTTTFPNLTPPPSTETTIGTTMPPTTTMPTTPRSLPCITNQALFCSLLTNHSEVGVFNDTSKTWFVRTTSTYSVKPTYYTEARTLSLSFPTSALPLIS